jgi:hypothetical protein
MSALATMVLHKWYRGWGAQRGTCRRRRAADIKKRFSRCALRACAAVACAASILVLAPRQAAAQATAQDKLDRIEWFAESGESLLSFGHQPGVFQVPELIYVGEVFTPYQATVVSPSQDPSSRAWFTGLRYRLTSEDAIEVSYLLSVNHFGLEPVGGGARWSPTFERTPALELNYARYFGSLGGWRPFAVGGAGVVWQSTFVTGPDRREPSFDFGFGADHRITDRLAFRVEVRDHLERLASPLHGYSNGITPTAGLVFSSRPAGAGSRGLSRIEIYLEGGGSFFSGRGVPTATLAGCFPPGAVGCTTVTGVIQSSYSKAGRYAGGFRAYLSRKNALQFEYSTGPNRTGAELSAPQPPRLTYPLVEWGHSVEDLSVDFVRSIGEPGAAEPFVEAGGGLAHFAGYTTPDFDKFCWNFGGGVDFPLTKQLALRFEMRDFLSPQPDPTIHGWTNNLTPMAGLALRFR